MGLIPFWGRSLTMSTKLTLSRSLRNGFNKRGRQQRSARRWDQSLRIR
jgi:hypothetical protein